MKENRTTKLYQGLTSKQKAALTLHYICEEDTAEIDRIRSTVEWKTYRCIDAEYSKWRDQFFKLSLIWGIMYWRALCELMSANRQLTRLNMKNADSETQQAFETAEENLDRTLARMVALQEALKEVCRQHGLGYEDIIKVAGVSVEQFRSGESDTNYQQEVTKTLLDFLTPPNQALTFSTRR